MTMKKILSAVVPALLFVGCGGGSPASQYLVSTDSLASAAAGSAGKCSAADPSNVVESNNEAKNQIISIYQLSDGTTYAEVTIPSSLSAESGSVSGRHVLAGTLTDNAYALSDTASTEQRSADGDPPRTDKSSQTLSLALTADGDFVSGTLSAEYKQSCDGSACPADVDPVDCIFTVKVKGQKLPDDGTQSIQSTPGH